MNIENKVKHLEMIQNIIQRMANNSFMLKGWAVTLMVAIFTLLNQTLKQNHFLFICVPVIAFWFLHSYCLQLERKYKFLYNSIRIKNNDFNFDLNIEDINYNSLNLQDIMLFKLFIFKK